MSAALPHSEPSTPIPSLRTTATVREYACLFTHDLRRKQKRWRDGCLKYHTFNKRAMVYDDRGNFVGDTHWQEDDLADGDEIVLERGGIVVQVGECVDRHDQDLSELIDKRAQERAQRQATAAARRSSMTPVVTPHAASPHTLRQKNIRDVIGTPSGHHGRAAPHTESPYEERRRGQTLHGDVSRPVKRQRKEVSQSSKNGYAQNLFGATLTLSGRPLSQGPVRHQPPKPTHTSTDMAMSSSSTSNHDINPSHTKDTTETRPPSRKTHGNLSRRVSQQGNHTPMAAPGLIRLHSSIRPVCPQRVNLGSFDEPDKVSTTQRQELMPGVDQEKANASSRSLLDCRPGNRKIVGDDEVLQHANQGLSTSKRIRGRKSPVTTSDCITKQRPRSPDLVDQTEFKLKGLPEENICNERRTELKLKPRKKRGLLMVTELDAPRSNARSLVSSTKDQSGDATADLMRAKAISTDNGQHSAELAQQNLERSSDNDESGDMGLQSSFANNGPNPVEDDEFDKTQCAYRSAAGLLEMTEPSATIQQLDQYISENSTARAGRLRSREHLLNDHDDFSSGANLSHRRLTSEMLPGIAAIDEVLPPRLEKLGRKGIRSRELIGVVFNEPAPIVSVEPRMHAPEDSALESLPDHINTSRQPHHRQKEKIADDGFVIAEAPSGDELPSRAEDLPPARVISAIQGRQSSGNLKFASNAANGAVQDDVSLPLVVTEPLTKQHTPALTNPATRGKKAAKPTDAAGQVPVCPLPMELAGRPPLPRTPSAESSIPGFSRAGGGPWSREASDLFDYRRPP